MAEPDFKIDDSGKVSVRESERPVIFRDAHFIYISKLFALNWFNYILKEVESLCVEYDVKMFGKTYKSKRKSCLVSNIGNEEVDPRSGLSFSYNAIPTYDWTKCPMIMAMKKSIEELTAESYDYCLVHIYTNGEHNIGWHNDKEAIKNSVFSVSLGATRKFRFRKLKATRGFYREFSMKSGDALWMLGPKECNNYKGCQTVYKHTVPTEKRISELRINLTFRKLS